jgi:hypothetical protein
MYPFPQKSGWSLYPISCSRTTPMTPIMRNFPISIPSSFASRSKMAHLSLQGFSAVGKLSRSKARVTSISSETFFVLRTLLMGVTVVSKRYVRPKHCLRIRGYGVEVVEMEIFREGLEVQTRGRGCVCCHFENYDERMGRMRRKCWIRGRQIDEVGYVACSIL